MFVGIEASSILTQHPKGIAHYTLQLLKQLERYDKATLQTQLLLNLSRRKDIRYLPPEYRERYKWHFKDILPLKRPYDILHFTDSTTVNLPKTRKVTTVHDLAVFMPEHQQIKGYTSDYFVKKTKAKLDKILSISNRIIAVSACTKRDIVNMFAYPAEQIDVVYIAADMHETGAEDNHILTKYRLQDKRYFLFTGSVSIRKNIINLVKAFKKADFPANQVLVLAGALSMGTEEIRKLVAGLQLEDRVVFTGFVTDAALRSLYKHAQAYVFPTYYEGFGLPIIEAMQFRLPLLTSNRGSAPEVANGYAQLVDPFSTDAIAEGLHAVLQVDKKVLDDAYSYAKSFSWKRCAAETYSVYKKLLS